MKTKNTNLIIQNKDIVGVFAVTTGILTLPLIGMQFSQDVDWTIFDFLIMGTLISGAGLLMVWVKRTIKSPTHRAAIIVAILAALFITWIHIAVGIVDTWPFAGS